MMNRLVGSGNALVLGKPTRIGVSVRADDGKIADGFVESAGDGSDGGFGGKETVLMKKWDWTRDAFQLTTDLVGFHGSRPFTLRPQRCWDMFSSMTSFTKCLQTSFTLRR